MSKNKKPNKKKFRATRQSKLTAKQVLHKAISEANALYGHGNIKKALALTQKALLQFPKNSNLLQNAGGFAGMMNDFPLAESYTHQSLAICPNDANLHNNLGLLLYKQDRFEQAMQCYQTTLKFDPNHVEGHNNLGLLLQEQQQADKAKQHYQIALKLNPNHVGAHNNLGVLLQRQQHFEAAKQHYQIALKFDPNHVDTRWNLSLLLLMLGHLGKAWLDYEYRYHPNKFKQNVVPPSNLSIPQYQGQILAGKSLLIFCEQGFGDNIQCVRYLPLLKQDKGVKHLVLACNPALSRLFNTMDCIDEVVNKDTLTQSQAQSLDYWVFIMSLPLHLNTLLETIPNQLPYLSSPKKQQKQWQDKLPKDSFNIGLVWKGQAKHKNDVNRSISSLSILKPLWQLKQKLNVNISFISLQKGAGEDEAANPPLDQPMIHLGTQIQDFADSAAIVSQLDLVISVDTAMVHLAGSLNIPCWILLPYYNTDWRWLIDREDSPWYPNSMHLFRQKTHGDWDEVIKRVVVLGKLIIEG